MTSPVTIPIKAVVDGHEQAAVRLACARLESSLSAASGAPVVVTCAFEPTLDSLDAGEACVVIASPLAEVANHQEPWPSVERRLRQSYQRLAAKDDVVVFICTVLRHVSAEEGAAQAESKRVRIRRLNLLAAEISRETGIYVIDLDRSLADLGARTLQTDYRLSGSYAAEVAAKFMALAVISAGLDAFVSFEVQDQARDDGCGVPARSRKPAGRGARYQTFQRAGAGNRTSKAGRADGRRYQHRKPYQLAHPAHVLAAVRNFRCGNQAERIRLRDAGGGPASS